jgi:hypothetical protein
LFVGVTTSSKDGFAQEGTTRTAGTADTAAHTNSGTGSVKGGSQNKVNNHFNKPPRDSISKPVRP